jgi:hypothetical protein
VAKQKPRFKIGDLVNVVLIGQIQNSEPVWIAHVYEPVNGVYGYDVLWPDATRRTYEEGNLEPVVFAQTSVETDSRGDSNWAIRTLVDARRERPPTEYIIDKFISAGSLSIVFGAPGSLKSLLIADACCAVAGGHPWLPNALGDGKGINTKQGAVFWYDYDNGNRLTDSRFDALSRAHKLPDDAPLYYTSMPQFAYIATDGKRNIYMEKVIKALGARLVVIDNLGLITGDVEENSAAMTAVMGGLRKLAENTGAAVVVIHHQRKGGAMNGRAGDALRGHSSIEAALDLALHVVRETNSSEITVKSTKTRGVDVPPITARFNFTHHSDSHDLEMAWFDGVAGVRGTNPIRDAIMAILGEHTKPITKGMLIDETHSRLNGEFGKNKIGVWVDELVAHGELEEEKGKNNRKLIKGIKL